jgi:uncharacterized protein (TIGR00159 family)
MRPADFLDIAVITIFLYFALAWLRQQASRSVAVALAIAAALYIVATQANMYLTSQLFKAGLTAILVALVLIFHTDIRRIFERFATWKVFTSKHGIIASNTTIDIVTESVAKLADDKVGALIVLRGLEPLERHIRGGIFLNGKISSPLLYGLFNTGSPTHDGAIILEGETIERFGVYLPLSQNVKEGGRAGTRHAAALGLSERCDALILVVSEERGTIGIAEHGTLERFESAVLLKSKLQAYYQRIHPSQAHSRRMKWLTKNIGLKLSALALAVGLWWFFAYRVTTIHRTVSVPIEYRNLPTDCIMDDPGTSEARISLSGPERSFTFDPQNMVMAVDLSSVHDGAQEIPLSDQALQNRPSGATVSQILPRAIRIHAYRMIAIELPVKVPTIGSSSGKIDEIHADPSTIRVLVPRSRRTEFLEIRTEPVNLKEINKATTVRLNCILPEHAQFADAKQTSTLVSVSFSGKK